MKLVVALAAALITVLLLPTAGSGMNYSVSRGLATVHTSNQKDTVPPVVETWSIWDRMYSRYDWDQEIQAELGVSDDQSWSYMAKVKIKFKGRTVDIWPREFDGICSDYGSDWIYIGLNAFSAKWKRGHYIAYVSAWDEAGNKSKAKRVDFWVR